MDIPQKTITLPEGMIYFDNDRFSGLFSAISGRAFSKGEPVKFPAYEGLGTGVQKIDSLIELFTPLTDYEKKVCNDIASKIRKNRPVIDPRLMMFYKMNKCDKTRSI